jgi:hypothetical protein
MVDRVQDLVHSLRKHREARLLLSGSIGFE